MHRALLDVLVDPQTGEPLELVDDPGGETIAEGTLRSPSGAQYPIVGGVPRFVPTEEYAGSFGLQWNRFARVQFDSHSGADYSRRRFLDETGWTDADIAGRWVLDAGCGSGRFAEIAASLGANVLAVDLSSAVDATAANLGHLPNVHVVQADISKLPVDPDRIEFLYSIGVLQHTSDPLSHARSLVSWLRPGARFCFTIYARRWYTKLYAKYLVRPVTRRMDAGRLLRLIERAMPVLFPVTSFLFALPGVGKVARFLVPVANYVEKSDVSRELRYEEAVLDTFDMLAPRFDQPVTADEVTTALADRADLRFVERVPVVVRGTRS